jgi:hypothetical protein
LKARPENNGMPKMSSLLKELIIPKEKAVFWLDGRGRWHNEHGVFENKKIAAYFHSCIQRDEHGYFLGQERDGLYEKVYFAFEDTALFVFELASGRPDELTLNTGRRIPFAVEKAYIQNDSLYLEYEGHRIKFSERVLLKISERLVYENGVYYLRCEDRKYALPEKKNDRAGPW